MVAGPASGPVDQTFTQLDDQLLWPPAGRTLEGSVFSGSWCGFRQRARSAHQARLAISSLKFNFLDLRSMLSEWTQPKETKGAR